jgi:putative addiction module component (TIGR02574 family)
MIPCVKDTHGERRLRMRIKDLPEISKLSTPEKILLVEDLWDNISADDSTIPVPESHKTELDKRLKRYQSAPGTLLSLDDLKTSIEKRN